MAERALLDTAPVVSPDAAASVAILLCTFNGQHHLHEQLASFDHQRHRDWRLWVSDDGSTDDTLTILRRYQNAAPGRIHIQEGPRQGFVANFMSLTCQTDIDAAFYAYADQDDIWELDKLQRAIELLNTVPTGVPALYCTRTRVVDAAGRPLGFSPLFSNPPDFANALVQNVAGGNTMVFNRRARDLLRALSPDAGGIVSQDWWAYLVVSGCGGTVFYDAYPSVRYRQHGGNLVGANNTWIARMIRMRMLWQGRFKRWTDLNLSALAPLRDHLTADNRALLDRFAAARSAAAWQRPSRVISSGVHRQTTLGTLSLLLAAALDKV